MVFALSLWLVLFATWLLLSGHFTPFLTGLGAFSCVLVVAIAWRMNAVDREPVPVDLSWRVLTYWPWLLVEIVKSNIDVTRRILSPSLPISPTVVKLKALQRSELGKVIYANSITLTPGTVSIDVQRDEITVHAISEDGAAGLLAGAMNRKAAGVEGR